LSLQSESLDKSAVFSSGWYCISGSTLHCPS